MRCFSVSASALDVPARFEPFSQSAESESKFSIGQPDRIENMPSALSRTAMSSARTACPFLANIAAAVDLPEPSAPANTRLLPANAAALACRHVRPLILRRIPSTGPSKNEENSALLTRSAPVTVTTENLASTWSAKPQLYAIRKPFSELLFHIF